METTLKTVAKAQMREKSDSSACYTADFGVRYILITRMSSVKMNKG